MRMSFFRRRGARACAAALMVVAAALAGCGGGGGGQEVLERTDQFRVSFAPNPVDASYDGRAFWWRYEVIGENVAEQGLHLAGFYIDTGDNRWRWHNGNLPFPAGRRVRVFGQAVRIDPARVQLGTTVVHRYRFVVMDGAGKFEVPASVELRY